MNGDYPNSGFGAPPTAPPAMNYAPAGPPESSWPKVLGVIMIVFGALGALFSCSIFVVPYVMEQLAKMMPPGQEVAVEALEHWAGWMMTDGILSLVLAVLCMIAGAGLMQRKRWAIRLSLAWAVMKLMLVVAEAVFQYKMSSEQMEAAAQQDPGMGAMSDSMQNVAGITAACTVLLLWALPLFILIWLGRAKIKEETSRWDQDVRQDQFKPL